VPEQDDAIVAAGSPVEAGYVYLPRKEEWLCAYLSKLLACGDGLGQLVVGSHLEPMILSVSSLGGQHQDRR
jgi:hypothetical protein